MFPPSSFWALTVFILCSSSASSPLLKNNIDEKRGHALLRGKKGKCIWEGIEGRNGRKGGNDVTIIFLKSFKTHTEKKLFFFPLTFVVQCETSQERILRGQMVCCGHQTGLPLVLADKGLKRNHHLTSICLRAGNCFQSWSFDGKKLRTKSFACKREKGKMFSTPLLV